MTVPTVSDIRRAVLREATTLFIAGRVIVESAALALSSASAPRENEDARNLWKLADTMKTVAETTARAAFHEDVFIAPGILDEMATDVELEDGDVTLVVPNDTPDVVVKALFAMARPLTDGPARYTMKGLAACVVGAILTANGVEDDR